MSFPRPSVAVCGNLLLLLSVAAPLHAQSLTELLARAAVSNQLPPTLARYTARVETEIAVAARREEGTEAVAAIEQIASRVTWDRAGVFDQTVIGYRNRQIGANVSLLSLFQTGWLNPVLYGNRLRIRSSTGGREPRPGRSGDRSAARPRPRRGGRDDGADTLPAIHPLAADRDRYYHFTGGDTAVVIRVGDRSIPIVNVRVQPRADVPADAVLFDGDLSLDASRGALVRLRGYFLRRGAVTQGRAPLGVSLGDAVAYVEYENGERLGAYWLPARQRIELQAGIPVMGDGRAVVRIVSRFSDMQVEEEQISTSSNQQQDTIKPKTTVRRYSVLAADSLSRFADWHQPVGALVAGMHADDFLDLAPDRWRPTGPPRFDITAPRPSDVFHFNRVEGAFTGFGVKWALRDAAPGVTLRANAGYAWAEQTVRGRVQMERARGTDRWELRAGRSLDNTNDFRTPFDSGNTVSALVGGIDPYDYVSRSSAVIGWTRQVGTSVERRRALWRIESGVADDRYAAQRVTRGLLRDTLFRENRGVDEGRYLKTLLLAEWHPDRAPEFVTPGWSARAMIERGDGHLTYTRTEARVTMRQERGPFTMLARADAGVVTGARIPPQQLFELGRFQNLPGYGDKVFAGSRSAVARASLQYTGPWFRRPIRLTQRLWLPAPAPGLSLGVQSGWADAPTSAARDAMRRLDTRPPNPLALYAPLVSTTGRVRATVTAGVRLFGNGLFLGASRAVDQVAPWRALVGFGQIW